MAKKNPDSGKNKQTPKANKQAPKPASKQAKKKVQKPGSSADNWPRFALIGILALTFVAFIPSLMNGFTNWDDGVNLIENPYLNAFNWQNIKSIFTTTIIGNYNPLPIFTFAIEKALFGMNATVFHVNNLLLHLACTGLVFWLIRAMKFSLPVAIITTLLFGIHPMRVESVAWITERKDVLFGVFYLGALVSYAYYLNKNYNKKYFWIALALFIPALLSKIQAVSLPLSFLAMDYLYKRELKLNLIIEKIPFFLLSLLTGLAGIFFLEDQGSLEMTTTYPLWQRPFIGTYTFVVYLMKFVFPYEMCALYPYPKELANRFYLSVIPVLMVLGAAFYFGRKSRKVGFGFLFFLFNIMFMLQVLGAGQGFLADRFTYIAYIGLFFMLAIGYEYVIEKFPAVKWPVNIGLAIYFIIFFAMTYVQCGVWKNSETLWTHVLKYYPDISTPYQNRGKYYREQGQTQRAMVDYNKALQYNPGSAETYTVRGKVFFDEGNLTAALEDFNMAITLDPKLYEALTNRAGVHASQQNFDKALEDLSKSIAIKPDFRNSYMSRSLIYMQSNRFQEALADYDKCIELDPSDIEIYYERAIAKRRLKDLQGALADANKAIEGKPTEGRYYNQRAQIYHELGNKSSALQDAQTAAANGTPLPPEFMQLLR